MWHYSFHILLFNFKSLKIQHRTFLHPGSKPRTTDKKNMAILPSGNPTSVHRNIPAGTSEHRQPDNANTLHQFQLSQYLIIPQNSHTQTRITFFTFVEGPSQTSIEFRVFFVLVRILSLFAIARQHSSQKNPNFAPVILKESACRQKQASARYTQFQSDSNTLTTTDPFWTFTGEFQYRTSNRPLVIRPGINLHDFLTSMIYAAQVWIFPRKPVQFFWQNQFIESLLLPWIHPKYRSVHNATLDWWAWQFHQFASIA